MDAKRNQCEFTGNLVRDVELRFLSDSTALASFSLAISNDYKKGEEWVERPASFLDFTIWGEKAESLAKEARKGLRLNVEGKAEVDQWVDKETGGNRSRVKFRVFDYQVVAKKTEDETSEVPTSAPKRGRPKKEASKVEDDDDDIPF